MWARSVAKSPAHVLNDFFRIECVTSSCVSENSREVIIIDYVFSVKNYSEMHEFLDSCFLVEETHVVHESSDFVISVLLV